MLVRFQGQKEEENIQNRDSNPGPFLSAEVGENDDTPTIFPLGFVPDWLLFWLIRPVFRAYGCPSE